MSEKTKKDLGSLLREFYDEKTGLHPMHDVEKALKLRQKYRDEDFLVQYMDSVKIPAMEAYIGLSKFQEEHGLGGEALVHENKEKAMRMVSRFIRGYLEKADPALLEGLGEFENPEAEYKELARIFDEEHLGGQGNLGSLVEELAKQKKTIAHLKAGISPEVIAGQAINLFASKVASMIDNYVDPRELKKYVLAAAEAAPHIEPEKTLLRRHVQPSLLASIYAHIAQGEELPRNPDTGKPFKPEELGIKRKSDYQPGAEQAGHEGHGHSGH